MGDTTPFLIKSLAIFAISSESVDTITREILSTFFAILIDHPISGVPFNGLMFFPGRPLDPPLAQISAMYLMFLNRLLN